MDVHDRLEHDRTCLVDRFQERLAARRHKGHFLGIDGMTLPVVDDYLHILHWIAGDGAMLHDLQHAFFHRWNVLPGDRATFYFIHELEAAAARQRLDAQIDFAELPSATSLLFMPAVSFGRRCDRLAIRDARR